MHTCFLGGELLLGREGQARAAAFKAQGKDGCMHAHMHACVLTRFHTGLYTVSILHSHAGPYTRDSLPPCTLKSLHTKDFLHTDAQASTSSHAQVCIHSLHTLTRRSQAAHPCSSAYTLSHKDLLARFAHIHTQFPRTLCAHSHEGLHARSAHTHTKVSSGAPVLRCASISLRTFWHSWVAGSRRSTRSST